MFNGKTFLAIIPARSGSKGLKKKNLKKLCGKHLIGWSIDAALKSKYIDEVILSTDDNQIAKVAQKYGAKVPFIRPEFLARDTTPTFDVIEHAINYYKTELKKRFDYVVLLEPTSPLREIEDIDNPIEKLINSSANSIVGISKTESQNPSFLVLKDEQSFISGYENPNIEVIRRQNIKDVFFLEGSIYISKTDVLLNRKTFYHEKTIGYEIQKYKSFEIDDIYDFVIIEALMKYKSKNYDL